ncbi:MAG: sulfite exporter TauE/SafE family protein [Cyclobacteriaceae bacterium]|nr:sulfite exporter TauE/SafE family protein [Cyclobacteriaceae bacterium]
MASSELFIPLLIIISLLISLFGSIVGFGGGIFIVPILITFFNYPLDAAVGATMVSLIPAAFMSTYFNQKEGNVDFKMGILLELPTMVGVVLGSILLSYISAQRLEIVFAMMVFIIGLSFFITPKKKDQNLRMFYKLNKLKPRFIIKNEKKNVAYRASLYMISFFGLLAGTLAGLFGMGGGFMKTPVMIKVFRMPAKIATSTALFMIFITSITGSISHYYQGHIYFEKAWPVMLGFTMGAIVGHRMNTHIKVETLEKLIGVALTLAAMVMLFNLLLNRLF